MIRFKGKSIYKGIALGPVMVLKGREEQVQRREIEDAEAEIEMLKGAIAQAQAQLQNVYDKALQKIGESGSAIFKVHQMMLEAEDYWSAIHDRIRTEKVNAAYAVAVTGDSVAEMFDKMDDEYMRARATDIKDISGRLIRILEGDRDIDWSAMEPSIIVADDLSPSETVQMDREKILALVTVHGSPNSHSAILARMMNIPALIGVSLDLKDIHTGMTAVVDGFQGEVIFEP